MAEVRGFLREDATFGEKLTLRLLTQNLPKEFTVYVESPLHKRREIRYPDFIVLTNYGVIVLEVKDWIIIEHADPHRARIRTRENQTRSEPNPVNTARDLAIILSNELKSKQKKSNSINEHIPWSYAAVLINLPRSVITQLRNPWGEEFVLGKDDLQNQSILLNRIKMTFPADRMRPLTREEISFIRATVYPVVEIDAHNQQTFILDDHQEKIVVEPIREAAVPEPQKEMPLSQEKLFEIIQSPDSEEKLPEYGEKLSQNFSIRLIRGVAGSGKSLVLAQRAKYLSAQYPEWKIAVLTFNKALQGQMEQVFKGTSIHAKTFHSLCQSLLHKQDDPFKTEDWLEWNRLDFMIIRKLGKEFVNSEFQWIRELGLVKREDYLAAQRKGRGHIIRLTIEQRSEIFDAFDAYQSYLRQNNRWDWAELPLLVLNELDGKLTPTAYYDAILIDEAQDWAPIWFRIINKLISPAHGFLFLADDPSQSIYRLFSWKQKGIQVSGRTRWLRKPYRNTFEIYRTAYCMIANNSSVQASLLEQGELIEPEISSDQMRHGSRPLIQKFRNSEGEIAFIKSRLDLLRREGINQTQIAVLVRKSKDVKLLETALKGYQVRVQPIHGFKGLEVEAVFIPHLQETFEKDGEEQHANESRLLYMTMSRARSQLFLTYSGKLPTSYEVLRKDDLADFLG